MAKVDIDNVLYMNPAVYANAKTEKEEKKSKGVHKTTDKNFSLIYDDLRGVTSEGIGQLKDLPPSEEAIIYLMDEVRSTGDDLKNRPLPEEITRYKQAVRNFINHVVKYCYEVDTEKGILNKFKPQFKGRRTPEADDWTGYSKINIIDKKLEELAANLLSGQRNQLELVSRLDEIKGLLVDLLQ